MSQPKKDTSLSTKVIKLLVILCLFFGLILISATLKEILTPQPVNAGATVLDIFENKPSISCLHPYETLVEITDGEHQGERRILCGDFGSVGDVMRIRLF